ncbi:non-ribosomal peptide synthetase [Microbacterium sp. No. 7]|uniref:non-ribosomal peptide synthetase n=1 Tax=Microbacterium sp. No. 7 TaxID=1714373 RepID=UPI0006D21805|nr:non-ribosomal peptide synthetase [Microbacterium sp. No. 7]ALJ20080.1 hypothetical protein AOA12_09220 [Microbacterium sp. No. 7]
MPHDADHDWLPLTAAQQGLFFAHQLDPRSTAYTTAEVVDLHGDVDADRLAAAVAAAYREFPQLRTEFRLTAQGPEQRVRPPAPVPFDVVGAGSDEDADRAIRAALERPFDLPAGETTRTGLVRLPGRRAQWWHAAHHVVCDGYGAQQLLRRIAELYAGAEERPPVPLAALVAEDHRAPASEAFWDERLAAMTGSASLAGRVQTPAPRAIRRALALDDELQAAIAGGARRLGTTWADLLVAAAGSYVARFTGGASARIGLPLMNRALPGVGALVAAQTVCTAMNVLPATIPASGTVADALDATRAEQRALRAHPFERQERLARRLARRSGTDLFGLQVNLIPFGLELTFGDTSGTVRNVTAGPVEDLTLTVRGTPGRGRDVRLELDAHPALYDDDDLDLHLERLRHWIGVWAAADAETPVDDLELLPDDERRRLVPAGGFNDTAVAREPRTLGQRFAAQAARTPSAVALRHAGESRAYCDLDAAARRIATLLVRGGVRPGDAVGVRLERGFGLYEAIHALALIGAVYLPIDVELPAARIADMLEDARSVLVIDDETLADARREQPWQGDVFDDVDAPAYLLFTSGSTGRPKGVLVSHRAIDNRLAWMQHHLALAPDERVLHKTPISFDVSVWELFWPLQQGAAVVIAPPGAHRDPREIARLLVDERVGVVHFVPSMLRAFLDDRVSRGVLATADAARPRAVVTSGEALTAELVAGSREVFGVFPVNLYGPTEAAVDITAWDCGPDDAAPGTAVPIGRPVWNSSCLVLDARLRPVPIGATGELWLGGVQLAIGYVGRADLTAQRFVETPWGRLYRTGDLAAWRPDGALRYGGRIDDQVKIRGQRVELGEIEAVLLGAADAAGVRGVAVGAEGGRLVAWFAADGETDGDGARGLVAGLRAAAEARLPAGFVPAEWIRVPQIPLSPSGKTDRRRLREQWPAGTSVPADGTGPRDLLEQRLCAAFADVLGMPSAPADADFFALGGDSLSVLRLIGRIEDECALEPRLSDVFAHPTPAALAAALAGRGTDDGAATSDFDELLTLRRGEPGGAPLFLLPPAGGLGWCYTSLLPSLPRDLPVHVVQAPGLGEGAPQPAASLGALARRQLAAIRAVVPDGPFHVAGWSLGGMAAHAVAALARSEGQPVGAVVLLDAYPAEQWQHLSEPTEADALLGVLRLAGLDETDPRRAARLDRAEVARRLRGSGSALAALPERLLNGCIASVIEAARIVRTAPPGVLPGDLTLIEAAAPRSETHLDPEGWHGHVAGEVRIVRLPVTHAELVRRPAAAEVAAVIASEVQRQGHRERTLV